MKHIFGVVFLFLAFGAALAQDQQLGARTKAMGGSYTAFEDDPVSVWLNPAGIATQPAQMAVAYQTYTVYPVEESPGPGGTTLTDVNGRMSVLDPPVIPSYAGLVFPLGSTESPMAIGICYARPYVLGYALDHVTDPIQSTFTPEASVEESFHRFRVAFAKDFRFRKPGEAGFLPHLAVGAGADLAFESWEFHQSSGDRSGRATSFGFGAGLLVGVYDNCDSLRVNLGVAYQSFVKFDFPIRPDLLPAFDMPQQLNVGTTFYLLSGTPLRVTLDMQWIDWSVTAEAPAFANHPTFEDALSFSAGVEYRFALSEKVFLYPRAGYRRFDAPWADEKNLPMTGPFKLVLKTKDGAFNIFTFGVGISWTTDAGKVRSIDLAGDVGGDAVNLAAGYTHEF